MQKLVTINMVGSGEDLEAVNEMMASGWELAAEVAEVNSVVLLLMYKEGHAAKVKKGGAK